MDIVSDTYRDHRLHLNTLKQSPESQTPADSRSDNSFGFIRYKRVLLRLFFKMCFKTTCGKCGKVTWQGKGLKLFQKVVGTS